MHRALFVAEHSKRKRKDSTNGGRQNWTIIKKATIYNVVKCKTDAILYSPRMIASKWINELMN